jgi:hypothetical protein
MLGSIPSELALFSEQFSVLSCEGTKGSPSIPARPYALKNTGDFKADEKFVPGLKRGLRFLWMPGRNDAGDGFGHDGGFCTPWLRQVGQCIVRPYERLFTDFMWCSDVRVKIEPCLGGKMQFSV